MKIPMLTRPFANAHWALPLGVIAAWELTLVAGRCVPGAVFIDFALGATTVCLAFWVSHLRALPVAGWRGVGRILGGAVYDLLILVLLVVLIAIPLKLVVPQYSCMTPRAKAAEVIVYGSTYRSEVAGRAAKQKSLKDAGAGLKVKPGGRVKGGYISRDGMIILVSDDPPVFVVLSPRMQDGAITWTCSGMPARLMPGSCRDELRF